MKQTTPKTFTATLALLSLAAGTVVASGVPAHAGDPLDRRIARFATDEGNIGFLALGTVLPLLRDGKGGRDRALRVGDAALSSTIITYALKETIREKRPDGSSRDSFPSGHATAAFAVATMESAYHPKEALLWYGGAAIISWSRVRLNRHYTQDVLAGAVIGYATSRWELSRKRGLLLSPFVGSLDGGSGRGFGIRMVKEL